MYSAFTAPDVELMPYAPLRAFSLPVDVLHLQWPEGIFEGRIGGTAIGAYLKARSVLHTCRKVRRNGGIVALTVHNHEPHAALNAIQRHIWKTFFARLLGQTDLFISMSNAAKSAFTKAYPQTAEGNWAIIPHPHYRKALNTGGHPQAATPAGSDTMPILGIFGSMRSSKKIPAAIDAFRKIPERNASLTIAGSADVEEQQKIERAVDGDDTVRVKFGKLTDDELVQAHIQSDAILFNQDTTLNSGSVLTALSLGRAVIAPAVGSLPELQMEVGDRWLRLFSPPLSATELQAFLAQGFPEKSEQPDLSAFDPAKLSNEMLRTFTVHARNRKHRGNFSN